ncbi:MAG: class I SAM-dependent methyltransferase [Nocardioides sp.]
MDTSDPGLRRTTDDWFSAFESDLSNRLPSLVPSELIVPWAARGAGDPGFQRDRIASYPTRLALSGIAHRAELTEAMTRVGVKNARVLDVGCGPGIGSRLLLEAGADSVVGCDVDPAMIATGCALVTCQRLDLQVLDVETALPFATGEFDVIWVSDYWSDVALPELRRVLRSGGKLVQTATAPWGQTYAFDAGLDLRTLLAEHRAISRWRGRAPDAVEHRSQSYPGWNIIDAWTSFIERRFPIPEIYREYRSQAFGLFTGGFLVEHVTTRDWRRLSQLWDSRGDEWLFGRPDAHLISGLDHRVWEPDSCC